MEKAKRRGAAGFTAAVAVCLMGALAPASADEGAVDYRQNTMAAVGGHMHAAVDILRGKVSHSGHMALHAGALSDLAGIAGTLFPEGSEGGDSLPAIWENGDDFAERLAAFEESAANFATAAESGDAGAIGTAFQGLGQACKSCHDDYRAQ